MLKYFYVVFSVLSVNAVFAQKYDGYVVTVDNDTIKTKIEFTRGDYDVNRLRFLQERIVTFQNNNKKVYYPNELLSFQIEIDYKIFTFDNINNTFFAQRLYWNKIKINKHISPSANILLTSYIIKRPNINEISFVPVLGLRNLVSRKAMLNEFSDCLIMFNKLKNKEIRIRDEQAFIDFVKDYEVNCYIND